MGHESNGFRLAIQSKREKLMQEAEAERSKQVQEAIALLKDCAHTLNPSADSGSFFDELVDAFARGRILSGELLGPYPRKSAGVVEPEKVIAALTTLGVGVKQEKLKDAGYKLKLAETEDKLIAAVNAAYPAE